MAPRVLWTIPAVLRITFVVVTECSSYYSFRYTFENAFRSKPLQADRNIILCSIVASDGHVQQHIPYRVAHTNGFCTTILVRHCNYICTRNYLAFDLRIFVHRLSYYFCEL